MKTEKVGVLIYYKHLRILEEAQLTNEQIGKIFRAIIRYDETGEIPKFPSPLSAWFSMIKYDVDANREKWLRIKEERSAAGRKGGRPPKAKEPNGLDESEETNWLEPPSLQDIKDAARNNGFFIDQHTAANFCDCGLEPDWMQGAHSFFEFVAEKIQSTYGNKPQAEQKALFISAVRTWDELRDEYPGWKAKKDEQDIAFARKASERRAWDAHPVTCSCGNSLRLWNEMFHCDSCGGDYRFDKEGLKWEYEEQVKGESLTESFMERIKGK